MVGKHKELAPFGEHVAGNGLLSRRIFLEGALVAGAAGAATVGSSAAKSEPLGVPAWSKAPGSPFTPYGTPSNFESKVVASGGIRLMYRAPVPRVRRINTLMA
jgi:hypothetical protein